MPESPRPTTRFRKEEVLAEFRRVSASPGLPRTLESVDAPLAIVNSRRQVVFANPAFRSLAGLLPVEELCGRRPGEALGCRHAGRGCGEAEACEFCGARQAIVETQSSGRAAARECHIVTDSARALDILVGTTPFQIDTQTFVMVSFRDVSGQKRRTALERLFFHDILNTASSFRVYLELLGRPDLPAQRRTDLLGQLAAVCDTLEEEIRGQKMMLSAESGTLTTQRDLVDSLSLIRAMEEQARGLSIAQGRAVLIAPFSEGFSFVSDDALVKRILLNMLKNALEASPTGATVTIGARRAADGRVVLSVHNVTSMDRTVQLQVFQRYFSTKGEGRGLGTWGMRMLAEDYLGGSVEFQSAVGTGTTFSLLLPPRPPDGETTRASCP